MTPASFPFPSVTSTVISAPLVPLFSPDLLSRPVPTNTFWQNYALNETASRPEYIHPYVVQSNNASLYVSYPKRTVSAASIIQAFVADFIISAILGPATNSAYPSSPAASHIITAYDDLSVTLKLPGDIIVPLVKGSPYITLICNSSIFPAISTPHSVLSATANAESTKYKISLNSGQTWLLYSSAPLSLTQSGNVFTASQPFSGVIRISLLKDDSNGATLESSPDAKEATLDRYSSVYPVRGHANVPKRNRIVYKWKTSSWNAKTGLLMLAHPIHRTLLQISEGDLRRDASYTSLDGDLVGVVRTTWALEEKAQIPISWHSFQKFQRNHSTPAADVSDSSNRDYLKQKVIEALNKDVADLKIDSTSTYFYGKAIAKAARLALIAEEIQNLDVLPKILDIMKTSINPWLMGTLQGNALVYEDKWGGVISQASSTDKGADFGLGLFNDHHFHLGYFAYAIAVLAKFDGVWAAEYKKQAYAIVMDYMAYSRGRDIRYPRVRNFDFWNLHSWASGITEFGDGRNQESTSEAINAYYAAALLGQAYSDPKLENLAATLLAMEIRAARTLWHIPSYSNMYEPEFSEENKIVGILWSMKRDSALWFAAKEELEIRTGIQTLPITPVTEALFCDVKYVQELVEWTLPALGRDCVTDGWRGFTYALQAIYQNQEALEKVMALTAHDDGNTLTNMLWWIYTRPNPESLSNAGYCASSPVYEKSLAPPPK